LHAEVEKLALKFLKVHDVIYQRSGGWIGHRLPFAPPNLLLHSVGAKTGKPRVNTLTYATDAGNYLIVASNGGTNRYPGWYHNLKAQPDVEINVGPKRFPVTARIVLPADPDYARLWQLTNTNNADRYAAYQEKTERPIAVIELSPR
jgi:deazaflavin-dependent oxidoreductase (nitroreductase family)